MLMCVVYLPLVRGMIWSRAVRIVSDWAVASFHGKMWRENEFEGVRDALMNHETNESVLAHASRVTFQSDMRFVGGSNARMDHFWGGVGHEKKESFNWICFFARCFSFDFVPIFASSLLHRAQHNLQWNTFTKWYYIIICVICLTFNVTYRIRSHFFWISFSMMRSHLFVWHIGMIWHVLAISGIKSPVDDKLKSSATSFSRRVNLSPDHHYRTIRIREKSDANQARKWCAVCCAVHSRKVVHRKHRLQELHCILTRLFVPVDRAQGRFHLLKNCRKPETYTVTPREVCVSFAFIMLNAADAFDHARLWSGHNDLSDYLMNTVR